jgi:hypothetical protein
MYVKLKMVKKLAENSNESFVGSALAELHSWVVIYFMALSGSD